jgi:hypothetical protein
LEDFYKISVYAEGSGVRVVFQCGGKGGLDIAREFFESPLFTPEETRMLYGLMDRARSGPREVSQRFEASASLTRRADMLIFVLRLMPRGRG